MRDARQEIEAGERDWGGLNWGQAFSGFKQAAGRA
jgi:hypothetical protein